MNGAQKRNVASPSGKVTGSKPLTARHAPAELSRHQISVVCLLQVVLRSVLVAHALVVKDLLGLRGHGLVEDGRGGLVVVAARGRRQRRQQLRDAVLDGHVGGGLEQPPVQEAVARRLRHAREAHLLSNARALPRKGTIAQTPTRVWRSRARLRQIFKLQLSYAMFIFVNSIYKTRLQAIQDYLKQCITSV